MKGIPLSFVVELFDVAKTLFTLLCILFANFTINLLFSKSTEALATYTGDLYELLNKKGSTNCPF